MEAIYKYRVQEKKKIRVIIDTDAANEADDQYAIVQALLTPKFIIKGLIAAHFNLSGGAGSVKKSLAEIEKLKSIMGMGDIPAFCGTDGPLSSETATSDAEGVDLIISEALKDDEKPLFVLCLGAITDVAAAINKCPKIAGRFTCIWIGGGIYPDGCWEFNLSNDVNAANAVFKSKVELWQVPMNVYMMMQIGYAELEAKVTPCGEIGKYLFDEMQDYGSTADWINGESWVLGDSPAVGLAINHNCGAFDIKKAPISDQSCRYIASTDHDIRVYRSIDPRYILEDLFAKLMLNEKYKNFGKQ